MDNSQKPLRNGPAPDNRLEPSVTDNISGLLRAVANKYGLPPWMNRVLLVLFVIYVTPFLVGRWLSSVAEIIRTTRSLFQ